MNVDVHKPKLYLNNNLNIVNQKGLFVIILYFDSPLEVAICKRVTEMKFNRRAMERILEEEKSCFLCFDIHKSLKEYTLRIRKEKGCDEDYVYPEYKNLYEYIVGDFMKT
jgi:hypothetical protein